MISYSTIDEAFQPSNFYNKSKQTNSEYFETKPIQNNPEYFEPKQKNQKYFEPKQININKNISNELAINLFYKIYNKIQNKNIIISPYSILSIFYIIYLASRNNTEIQIQKFFGFPNKQYRLDNIESPVFKKINLICVPNSFQLINKFDYNQYGKLIKLDLNNPGVSANKINSLISQTTNNMINNLINPEDINNLTVMILINAIYFKSNWVNKFKVSNKFYPNKNNPLIYQTETNNRYFEDNLNQILELDYKDGQFTMGLVLPKNQNPVNLQKDQLSYYINSLIEQEISDIYIPKFKSDNKFELSKLFYSYGLTDLFKTADLGNLISPNIRTTITKIIHRALIIVDENGTTAAASSYLCVDNCASSNKIRFIADHPFLYYIRYKPNNTIIFMGNFC